jgi:hypothetical protein
MLWGGRRVNASADAEEWENLRRPLGEPGSGLVRYAAAMHLRQRGLIDDAALERYRVCSRLDAEDPDQVR